MAKDFTEANEKYAQTQAELDPRKHQIHYPSVPELIESECDAVKQLLLLKNREYGNSALEPIGVFAGDLTPEQQIDVRIDDKLKRLQTIKSMDDVKIHEDTEQDLIGYLVLKRVARKWSRK